MDKKEKILKKLIILTIILFIIFIILKFLNIKHSVSELENIKINEVSKKDTKYIEFIGNGKDLDGYLIYILKNSEAESLSVNEMINKIHDIFNKEVKEKEIVDLGITPKMMDERINYDFETRTFSIDKSTDLREIATTEIIAYQIKDMYKDDNEYVVTYDKLKVKNPYDVLNYYNDRNKVEEVEEIQKYLQNEGSIDNILKYINTKNSKKSGEVTITYIVKNNKLLIEKIEEK